MRAFTCAGKRRRYLSVASRSRRAAIAALTRGPLRLELVQRPEAWLPLRRRRNSSVTSRLRRAAVAALSHGLLRLQRVRSEGGLPLRRRLYLSATSRSRRATVAAPSRGAVEARVRAAIRWLASTASPALLVSHASLEACISRITATWVVEACVCVE